MVSHVSKQCAAVMMRLPAKTVPVQNAAGVPPTPLHIVTRTTPTPPATVPPCMGALLLPLLLPSAGSPTAPHAAVPAMKPKPATAESSFRLGNFANHDVVISSSCLGCFGVQPGAKTKQVARHPLLCASACRRAINERSSTDEYQRSSTDDALTHAAGSPSRAPTSARRPTASFW